MTNTAKEDTLEETATAQTGAEVVPFRQAADGVQIVAIMRREGERFVVRSGEQELTVSAAPGVEQGLLDACLAEGRYVVLKDSTRPFIVGALQSRLHEAPAVAARAELAANQTVTLRAGKAAIVLHADGTITMKGTRLQLSGQQTIDLEGGKVKLP